MRRIIVNVLCFAVLIGCGIYTFIQCHIIHSITQGHINDSEYHHPQIKSPDEIYQIQLTDSVADICYDIRSTKVVALDRNWIQSHCPLDSNRIHFNVITK